MRASQTLLTSSGANACQPTLPQELVHVIASQPFYQAPRMLPVDPPLGERAIAVVLRDQPLCELRDVLRGALGAPCALHARHTGCKDEARLPGTGDPA